MRNPSQPTPGTKTINTRTGLIAVMILTTRAVEPAVADEATPAAKGQWDLAVAL